MDSWQPYLDMLLAMNEVWLAEKYIDASVDEETGEKTLRACVGCESSLLKVSHYPKSWHLFVGRSE